MVKSSAVERGQTSLFLSMLSDDLVRRSRGEWWCVERIIAWQSERMEDPGIR